MKKRYIYTIMALVFILGALTGCGGSKKPVETTADTTPYTTTSQPTTTDTTTTTRPTDTETAITSDNVVSKITTPTEPPVTTTGGDDPAPPSAVNYLTGLPLPEGDVGTRRPTAVAIGNTTIAMPQAGISEADIIFEMDFEGGVTRLLAIFYDPSKAGKIGSVRSARPVAVNIAMGFDALYAHAGYSPQAKEDMNKYNTLIADGITDTVTFYRDQIKFNTPGMYEHSLYTTGARLAAKWERLKNTNTRMELTAAYSKPFNFYTENTLPAGGIAANRINTVYGGNTRYFTYSPAEMVYKRYAQLGAHIDENNNAQLSFKNVIVLSVTSKAIPGDSSGRRDFNDVGSGTGIYATNGVYLNIKWSKASATAPLVLTNEDGSPLQINAGKTFISYVNGTSNYSVS